MGHPAGVIRITFVFIPFGVPFFPPPPATERWLSSTAPRLCVAPVHLLSASPSYCAAPCLHWPRAATPWKHLLSPGPLNRRQLNRNRAQINHLVPNPPLGAFCSKIVPL